MWGAAMHIPAHTCTMYIPAHTCTYLLIPVHTCSYLHIPAHTCTYLHIPALGVDGKDDVRGGNAKVELDPGGRVVHLLRQVQRLLAGLRGQVLEVANVHEKIQDR